MGARIFSPSSGMLLDDLELLVRQRAGLLEDLRRDADLADVVEERGELEPLEPVAVEAQLAADEQRHVGDPACVRGRVRVVRLECVRERRDGRHERALEALVVLGALDRELRLVRETCEQTQLAVVEPAVADRRGERRHPVALEPQRRDHVAGDRGRCRRPRSGRRRPARARTARCGPQATRARASSGTAAAPPPGRRRADSPSRQPRRDRPARPPPRSTTQRARCRATRAVTSTLRREHVVGRLGGRELTARLEQRVRDLGGLELLPVQPRLLQRDRGLVARTRRAAARDPRRARRAREHEPARDPVALGERRTKCRRRAAAPTLATQASPSHSDAPSVSNSDAGGLDRVLADLLDGVRARDDVGEREQRLGALGLAPLLLVEPRVLERDRRLAGEHLEQANVVLVELVQAELRDDDHAGDARPVAQRHDARATPRAPACRGSV